VNALLVLVVALLPLPSTADDCLDRAPAETARASGPLSVSVEAWEGRSVLRATGRIEAGATERILNVLQAANVDEVWLDSAGGDQEDAAKFGAELRRNTLLARIPAGAVCADACVGAFLAGLGRVIDPGGQIGIAAMPVSNEASTQSQAEREQAAGRWAERQADHYIRAGISRGLLRLQLETPAGTTCWLTRAAQQRYNVTNTPLIRPASNPPPALSRP